MDSGAGIDGAAGIDCGAGIDWVSLRTAAREAMGRAYAPYSRFPVGAAGLVDDGRVVVGCNVENASYGLGLCAECGLVSALATSGGGRLVAVACVDGRGDPLMPCGRCRQLLWEHGGAALLLDSRAGPLPMTEILPHPFDATDLAGSDPDGADPDGSDPDGSDPDGSDPDGSELGASR